MNEITPAPVVYQAAPAVVYQAAAPQPMSIEDIRSHVALVKQVQAEVMHEGEHYGVIPGTKGKPSLLKPGAEILVMTFRLVPKTHVEIIEMGNGHREYRATTELASISGVLLGNGVGSCSTMESKYRYRGTAVELTDQLVPKEYWNIRNSDPEGAQKLLGGRGFRPVKDETMNRWMIGVATGERQENPDPADQYNTCLKMAKKRAFVDAILTVTACSDSFSQDTEEEVDPPSTQAKKTETKAVPKTETKPNTKPASTASTEPTGAPPPGHPAADIPTEDKPVATPPKAESAKVMPANGKVTLEAWLSKTRLEIDRCITDMEAVTKLGERLAPWKAAQLAKLAGSSDWRDYIKVTHSGRALDAYLTELLAKRDAEERGTTGEVS